MTDSVPQEPASIYCDDEPPPLESRLIQILVTQARNLPHQLLGDIVRHPRNIDSRLKLFFSRVDGTFCRIL